MYLNRDVILKKKIKSNLQLIIVYIYYRSNIQLIIVYKIL